MAINKKYLDPQKFYYKILGICSLIAVDIFFNSFTQFYDFGSNNIFARYNITGYDRTSNGISYLSIA